jgi:hypothetical protein
MLVDSNGFAGTAAGVAVAAAGSAAVAPDAAVVAGGRVGCNVLVLVGMARVGLGAKVEAIRDWQAATMPLSPPSTVSCNI